MSNFTSVFLTFIDNNTSVTSNKHLFLAVKYGGLEKVMSNSNSNSQSVPEAKSAMNRFKMEVANEIGVPLSDGYNGNLTSAQNGSVGGQMVKKMIEAQEKQMANK